MSRKKAWFILSVIVLSITVITLVLKYPIDHTQADIEKHINEWHHRMRDSDETTSIHLHDSKQLGTSHTYAVFYSFEGQPALAVLEKGLTGNLRIVRGSSGTAAASYDHIQTSDGAYGIIRGKNPHRAIQSIQVDVVLPDNAYVINYKADYQFIAEVSSEAFFFFIQKLPDELQKETVAYTYFFDKEGKPFVPEGA